jgi:hypothetical protein
MRMALRSLAGVPPLFSGIDERRDYLAGPTAKEATVMSEQTGGIHDDPRTR